jgi:integrase
MWTDIDFDDGLIVMRASNTKTQAQRIVGMTPRVEALLKQLYSLAPNKEWGLVFGVTSDIKNGFRSALAEAQIEGLRFHDLRHTAITRMVNEGLPSMEIMKISGHTQSSTFQRYVNPTHETVRENALRLSTYNETKTKEALRDLTERLTVS